MNQKMMNRMRSILKRAQALQAKKTTLELQLVDAKANLADAEVEYADLQKEISDDLFGQSDDDEPIVDMPKRRTNKRKTTRRKLKKKIRRKGKVNDAVKGTRDQIQAAAKARDEKLIKVLKKAKEPMRVDELWKAVGNGSLEQMRTSLKRNRKKLKTEGYAKQTRYKLKRK